MDCDFFKEIVIVLDIEHRGKYLQAFQYLSFGYVIE